MSLFFKEVKIHQLFYVSLDICICRLTNQQIHNQLKRLYLLHQSYFISQNMFEFKFDLPINFNLS